MTILVRMTYLGGSVDIGAPFEQFGHDRDVSLLGGQVQSVETIGVAGVDVDASLEILEHFVQIASPGRPQEAGVSIGLRGHHRKEVN